MIDAKDNDRRIEVHKSASLHLAGDKIREILHQLGSMLETANIILEAALRREEFETERHLPPLSWHMETRSKEGELQPKEGLTEALNRVYTDCSSAGRVDSLLGRLQQASLPREEW